MKNSFASIILCGGQSTRMGRPKATLPFGSEPLILRMIRTVSSVTPDVIVVAAADQVLPDLPEYVRLVRDEFPQRGPLEGLRVGLGKADDLASSAFVTSCDAPLLVPRLIEGLCQFLTLAHDIVVPGDQGFFYPLTAVYRCSVREQIEQLLASDLRRPAYLFERLPTRVATLDELRQFDPELESLTNVNTPDAYRDALKRCGLPIDDAFAQ
jgi:molybdenum cofactor guanylyltransferase